MTQINSSTPIDFPNGKDVEIENFADLIIINCSKFEMFCLNNIISKLNLDSKKEKQFNSIILETTNLLKEYDLINIVPNTSGYFKLSQNGLLAKEKGGYFKYIELIKNKELENSNKTTINNFNNNTIGQFIQDSDLKDLTIDIKQTIQPKTNEKQQSAIVTFVEKWFWQIVIPLLLGIVLIAIDKNWNIF